MSFGSCCILKNNDFTRIKAKSVKIEGFQLGLILNFEVTQVFEHSEKSAEKVSYIFSNDQKICIYDTTFVVGDEIIKPKLQQNEEADKTFKEAVDSGHTAVLGTNIGYGLTEFKLGNLPPQIECKVILKIAFTAQITKKNEFFIKFPLDVYNPTGSIGCLDVSEGDFLFEIQSDKENIERITSNVKNGRFNEESKKFRIDHSIENNENEKSIIVTFKTSNTVENSAFLSSSNDGKHQGLSLIISPNLPPTNDTNCEFVFVVDCSGSMNGNSIKKASECLEFFIKSLPTESYFNIIRFGSRFIKLFEKSVEYNDETVERGIELASKLKADLGGTDILSPLESIFNEENIHGQRQIFVMTDGEVCNAENVLQLISEKSNNNRIFTIGIGRGCDAGLVEGMANCSSGKSDFVQENDNISEKVIPQLKSSLHPSLNNVQIHIENNESFEVSPFPIPSINADGSSVVFLRVEKRDDLENNSILIEGKYGNETVEFPIETIQKIQDFEEDKFGCSNGKNIGKAILPLFAFHLLKSIVMKRDMISDEQKMKAIELSISSGVLCKFTSFVGVTDQKIIKTRGGRTNKTARFSIGGCAPRLMSANIKACATTMNATAHSPVAAKRHRLVVVDNEEEEEKNEQKSKGYDLLMLTRYQKVAGCWIDLDKINEMLNLHVEHIDDVNVDNDELEKKCVATILAIAAMRVKSPNEKNTWEMIEQKAISWLKKNLVGIDIENVISKIQKIIQ